MKRFILKLIVAIFMGVLMVVLDELFDLDKPLIWWIGWISCLVYLLLFNELKEDN